MIRPVFFIWIVVPIAIYLAFMAWGLPHFAWSYSWRDDGQGYDPFAHRWYVSCIYIGTYGSHRYIPRDGKCPWFRFYKKREMTNAE